MPVGHCDDETAWAQWLERYGEMPRDRMMMGQLTDCDMANQIFMLDTRSMSLDGIMLQTAVKDRIRWLSVQLYLLETQASSAIEGAVDYALAESDKLRREAVEHAFRAGYLAREQQRTEEEGWSKYNERD